MRIITLGTGAGRPTLRRSSSATGLEYYGDTFLFDCGEGTQVQLMKIPFRWGKVKAIFISHLHGDHVNGLPGLLGTLSLSNRETPLLVFGPVGLAKLLSAHQECHAKGLRYPLQIHEITEASLLIETSEYRITAKPLRHVLPCWGYVFHEKPRPGRFDQIKADAAGIPDGPLRGQLVAGKSVALPDGRVFKPEDFVGPGRAGRSFAHCLDTQPGEEAIDLAKGVDLLLHEATFLAADGLAANQWGHSTAKDAAEVAQAAGVGQLILTHISQRYGEAQSILAEAAAIFPRVKVATDLDVFEVVSSYEES